MKKFGIILIALAVLIAVATLSFYAGAHMRDEPLSQRNAERFESIISFAIWEAETKGLSVDGAVESIASSIWVAHELCDDPDLSVELNDLWYTLVYEEETFAGQEEVLTAKLRDILERSK